MKVIFDNIIYFLQRSGGGSVYWTEIIKRAQIDKDLVSFFSEPKMECENLFRRDLQIESIYKERFPLNFLRILNFTIRIKEKVVFHSSYYRISLSKNAINIVTIHDFTPELFFTGIRRFIHKLRKKRAIYKADGIICISENTKKDLIKMYPKVNENKIRVIYNGVSDEFHYLKNRDQLKSDKFHEICSLKYILYIGHRTSYKNFKIAVEAISLLDSSFYFVIIGEFFSDGELNLLQKLIPNRYILFQGLVNSEVNVLYNHAFCLLYPSSYEGFGIPILEAMKAGCPVITTTKSSIPEVAGDAAILVDNISSNSFALAVSSIENLDFRYNMISKGYTQSEKFSWDKCYLEVKEFYRYCYAQRP